MRVVRLIVLLPVMASMAYGGAMTFDETTAAHWLDSRLLNCALAPVSAASASAPTPPVPGLDVVANNDPVIPNGRVGQPMKIGDRIFTRGLYCHAVSKVVVRLPAPGRAFSAIVGLDHNDDTARGRGSAIFSVAADGRALFRSPVMKYGTPACEVSVALGGATTFTLEVGDAGDGISWDQSDWAEAKVTLEDGRELWLGDMALRDPTGDGSFRPMPRSSMLLFSFEYGGQPSDALLAGWPRRTETRSLDRGRRQHVVTWTDARTGLEVRCVAVLYSDFPVTEWTVYFKNTGTNSTPLLRHIQGLDAALTRSPRGEFVLNSWKGDTGASDLYEPSSDTLVPGAHRRFAPVDGRGSSGAFPYYHLRLPAGGLLLAVGWPGQWSTCFIRDHDRDLRLIAGQERTCLSLKPGEEVRSPLIACMFSKGEDPVEAQNLWRRWMWAYNVPRTADGALPPPILFGNTSIEFNEMVNATEANQTQFIDRYVEERIPIDYWWMDAGWYPCEGQWQQTGTWEPDPSRFPRGLRAVSDHARARGIKTLVWFEPERVGGGWLSQQHAEWRIGALLNLGHPEAWRWLVDRVDSLITTQGIDLYRQDFNLSPLAGWRGNDAADRQGITENLHIQGYLAYWDELRRRHPQLIIDGCASGGRRNDLESLRRAVALHPTDYDYGDLTTKQAFHVSLFQWVPYFGSIVLPMDRPDPYAIRSSQGLGTVFVYDLRRKDFDYARLRELAAQVKPVADCYTGDFYPLTPYTRQEDQWIAWQFHRSDRHDGVIQAFRRGRCDSSDKTFRLKGLDPAARYRIQDLDRDAPQVFLGHELATGGLPVHIPTQPGAAVIRYSVDR